MGNRSWVMVVFGAAFVVFAQSCIPFGTKQVIHEGMTEFGIERFSISRGCGRRIEVHGVLHCSGKEKGEHHPGGEAFPTGLCA